MKKTVKTSQQGNAYWSEDIESRRHSRTDF